MIPLRIYRVYSLGIRERALGKTWHEINAAACLLAGAFVLGFLPAALRGAHDPECLTPEAKATCLRPSTLHLLLGLVGGVLRCFPLMRPLDDTGKCSGWRMAVLPYTGFVEGIACFSCNLPGSMYVGYDRIRSM